MPLLTQKRLLSLCVVAFLLSGRSNADGPRYDLACGPRCVQYILRELGYSSDLIALVEEIQGQDLDSGASFHDLDVAFARRDLYTQACFASRAWLEDSWDDFAIVHCETELNEGHFVVFVPASNGDQCAYWDGLRGTFFRFQSPLRPTGNVLLVSANPIDVHGELDFSSWKWLLMSLGGLLVCLAGARGIGRWVRSHEWFL